MGDRPFVLVSCAVSLDGYLDDAAARRLVLSNDDDLDRVDEVRAACDAILVGAQTLRNDDPRLIVRDPTRAAAREACGLPPSPVKVTVTDSGDLDSAWRFFTHGDGEKLVYCSERSRPLTLARVGTVSTVVGAGDPVDLALVLSDLADRGISRLMVEGGATILTALLERDLVDELQVAVAPLFVGDSRARRFVDDGEFPWHAGRRAPLLDARPVGDVVLLRYALSRRSPE